jgi:hypothetical protein
MRKLLSAVAAAAFAAGSANAAFVVDVDEPFIGSQTGEAGVFYDQDFNNETEFRYDVTSAPNTEFDVTFSSDGDRNVLERIRVAIGTASDSFSDFENMTFMPEITDIGTFSVMFDEFTGLQEDFSVFVQILNGPEVNQSFSLNIFAKSSVPVGSEIPVPGAGILLATAVGGFAMARRRRNAA